MASRSWLYSFQDGTEASIYVSGNVGECPVVFPNRDEANESIFMACMTGPQTLVGGKSSER